MDSGHDRCVFYFFGYGWSCWTGRLVGLGGTLLGAGLAGVLGGLVMRAWGGPSRGRMGGVLLGTLCLAGCALLTGLHAHPVTIGLGVFGLSLTLTLINGMHAAIVTVKVPQRLHGPVLALHTMIGWSALPIGVALLAAYASELLEPLLAPGGALAPSIGAVLGVGPGRGIALLYVLLAAALVLLSVLALGVGLPRLVDDSADATPDDLIGLAALGRDPGRPGGDGLDVRGARRSPERHADRAAAAGDRRPPGQEP